MKGLADESDDTLLLLGQCEFYLQRKHFHLNKITSSYQDKTSKKIFKNPVKCIHYTIKKCSVSHDNPPILAILLYYNVQRT